jgi:predicted phage-related endonuclease
LHPYHTPASIYARIVHGIERSVGSAAQLGVELEPAIIAMTGRRMNIRVRTSSWTYKHPRLPLVATVDAVGLDEFHDTEVVVEAKLVGPWARADWAAGPPWWVVDQVQVQLALSRRSLGIVGALIGGTTFNVYEVPADPGRQMEILQAVHAFKLNHLDPRFPPPVDPDRNPELVIALAGLAPDEIEASGDLLAAGMALDGAARARINAETAEEHFRTALATEIARAGVTKVVPPLTDPARWSATVVERNGAKTLRFLPSRTPKE